MQPEQDLPDFSAAFELVKPADRAARLSFFRMGTLLRWQRGAGPYSHQL